MLLQMTLNGTNLRKWSLAHELDLPQIFKVYEWKPMLLIQLKLDNLCQMISILLA